MFLLFCEKFQRLLNKLAQHPLTLGFAICFLMTWTAASFLSSGKFDGSFNILNIIINGLSILLLFAANTGRQDNHDETHEKLDEIHNHLKELSKNNK